MKMYRPLRLGFPSPSQVLSGTENFTADATANGKEHEGILFNILEESLSSWCGYYFLVWVLVL